MRVRWRRIVLAVLAAQMASGAVAADSPPSRAFFVALRQADLRVATIAFRLTTANASLCRSLQPELGMPLHALDQYEGSARAAADAVFGFDAGVEAEDIVPRGPADRAGVHAGDSIISVNGNTQPAKPRLDGQGGTAATRISVERLLAALPPAQPIRLTLRRGGKDVSAIIAPVPGCRTGVEMMLGQGYDADSDGDKIRIGSRFLDEFDDAEVAVIIAHELAHTILEHPRRLDAAGVSRGVFAELGRNGRLWRQTEEEADRLSVYLLFNAGYDPASAAKFWRGRGAKISGGLFRARTHFGPNTRAAALDKEVAAIGANQTRPMLPPMLALRDVVLN